MLSLEKNILATLAYYDVFDYPLTAFEVWKYLLAIRSEDDKARFAPLSLRAVSAALESESLRRYREQEGGFSFLRGRRELVIKRLLRQKNAIEKHKKVKKLARWLRFVPFVRVVALTGSLAMKNSHPKSDWDLLIILESGHIWTGRTIVTAFLHALGKRRHGRKIENRACLNYWITTQSLEIQTKDLFSSHEYFFLIPLFGFEAFQNFQKANLWIKNFRPQFDVCEASSLMCIEDTQWSRKIRTLGEKIFSSPWLEERLALWQRKKIADNPKTHWPGSLVQATETALIFLPKPQGPKVFERFKERLSQLESV